MSSQNTTNNSSAFQGKFDVAKELYYFVWQEHPINPNADPTATGPIKPLLDWATTRAESLSLSPAEMAEAWRRAEKDRLANFNYWASGQQFGVASPGSTMPGSSDNSVFVQPGSVQQRPAGASLTLPAFVKNQLAFSFGTHPTEDQFSILKFAQDVVDNTRLRFRVRLTAVLRERKSEFPRLANWDDYLDLKTYLLEADIHDPRVDALDDFWEDLDGLETFFQLEIRRYHTVSQFALFWEQFSTRVRLYEDLLNHKLPTSEAMYRSLLPRFRRKHPNITRQPVRQLNMDRGPFEGDDDT